MSSDEKNNKTYFLAGKKSALIEILIEYFNYKQSISKKDIVEYILNKYIEYDNEMSKNIDEIE